MYRHRRPAERPEDYPENIWPLWFVASAFAFSRRFGILFLAGLILDTILRLLILPIFQYATLGRRAVALSLDVETWT